MASAPHVLVIGGGIGGLCLAHGLRRAGVSVTVYERNRTRTDWLQGYRIHINPTGGRALHECLTPDLWQAFLDTAGRTGGGFGFLTEQLRELIVLDGEEPADPIDQHHSVSRITLRQVLLSGLDDGTVHIGKELTGFEQHPDGTVTARFADGTSASGDLLVGADGPNSRVRQQLLPHARRVDTGIVGVAGKIGLDERTRRWLPHRLVAGPNSIMPPSGSLMFTAGFESKRKPVDMMGGIGSDDQEVLRRHPGLLFENTRDYVFWAYVARRDRYEIDPASLDGPGRQRLIGDMIQRWHPDLRRLVAESDPSTVATVGIKSASPVAAWQTTNVTLLGDAIHNMTPLGGVGANTALRDAGVLSANLADVAGGRQSLQAAVNAYERAMLRYGFAAVRMSLRNAIQAGSTNRAARSTFKATLRLCAFIPPLKQAMFQGMGT